MDYYRINQIAMAVLGALLLFFGAKTIVNIAYEEHEPEKPGYEVAGTEPHGKPGEEKPGGGAGDLAVLLAAADPARGAEVAKKCAICHSFDKGGPNMIGPNLYGVLGHKIASHEGYEYSDALKAKEGDWDYEKINHMIENPNVFAPGTKMALFPGLPDAKQRADVIAFLRTKNDNPPPLPAVPAGGGEAAGVPPEKPGGEAAAGGGAAGSEVVALLATADPKQGETDAALCKVCHTFDKGGAALVGPNLYGVIGRKIASVAGFNYTPALKAHEGTWTYENLDPWLKNPQAFAPGTMMAFPGIPDAKKRANVIAFLRSKNDNPPPLPEGAPAGAPAEKAAETSPAAEPAAPAPEPAAPAPAAETPAAPAPAPEAAPAAETPPPAASAEPAPSAETPAPPAETPAPLAETPAPSAETPAASDDTGQSAGEGPSPSQPQPVYPDGPPDGQ
jgi:cytochrome c